MAIIWIGTISLFFQGLPGLGAAAAADRPAGSQWLALDAIGGAQPDQTRRVDLAALAHLLYFSAGVLRRRTHPGGNIYYRAAACTGALYHVDAYVVSAAIPELAAGIYHFGPHDFALRRLRDGDHRGHLVAATAAKPTSATRRSRSF
jgi:hypothetical protein